MSLNFSASDFRRFETKSFVYAQYGHANCVGVDRLKHKPRNVFGSRRVTIYIILLRRYFGVCFSLEGLLEFPLIP